MRHFRYFNYHKSRMRWPGWRPYFNTYKQGWLWVCEWKGPLGGIHRNYGFSEKLSIHSAHTEIASWSISHSG